MTICGHFKSFEVFKMSYWLTCWAEPEVNVSQHHKQQLPAQKLREAQRDVPVLGVRIVPPITRSAAEPPQQRNVQPSRDKHLSQNLGDTSGCNGSGQCSPAVEDGVNELTLFRCVDAA